MMIIQQGVRTLSSKLTPSFLLTGPDAESVPLQVLVHGCHMLRRLHTDGCCRGRHEQREGDLAAEMEYEPAHNRVLGKLSSRAGIICLIFSQVLHSYCII